ncbi:MAG TPA: penicillin-binding protein 2 [Candidatus Paceibacterota bacterium]|nr:penicillin-binding protein 2 [Candidatus Paceibacterota bacterium]
MKRDIDLEDILTDRFQENDLLEVPLSDGVFRTFIFTVVVVIGFVIFRIWDISILNHSFYKSRASANMSFMEVKRPARGLILDRNGEPILENESAIAAYLIPHDLPTAIDERDQVLKRISAILGINEAELKAKIRDKDWAFSEKLEIASNLGYEEIAAAESEVIPGLSVESVFRRRSKPTGVFSHIVGFTGLVDDNDLAENENLFIDDEVGKAGLEAQYDAYLRGRNGREIILRDAKGDVKEKTEVTLAEPGKNVETFIDRDFQEYFYGRLIAALRDLGRDVGVGLALDPRNGEVLALFSIPGFDVGNVSASLAKPNEPFFNRAISGLYNPGSTIKPLVAAAALAENVIGPKNEIYSAGYIEVPNPYNPENPSRFLDWKAHGYVNLRSALARSSNVYFYEVGGGFGNQIGLGIEKLRQWWHKFKLDEKTGIDLPGEKAGFLPSPAWKEKRFGDPWRIGDTYNVSIGQGDLLMTPIELLNYIASIANGGKFYQPRVMKRIVAEDGSEIIKSEPTVIGDLSAELGLEFQEVREGMEDAVRQPYGTAYLLADLPFAAAAKTGTAQIQNNEKVNAFFVGYAPADDPEIAILVLVENAREGSLNTVPVAKDALMWYYENRIKKQK